MYSVDRRYVYTLSRNSRGILRKLGSFSAFSGVGGSIDGSVELEDGATVRGPSSCICRLECSMLLIERKWGTLLVFSLREDTSHDENFGEFDTVPRR